MRISCGISRWILLIGKFAIKVPRLRLFQWTKRFFYWQARGEIQERLLLYHSNLFVAVLRYLSKGILANLTEQHVWEECPHEPLAPVLYSFFGLILIQVRGEPVAKNELRKCPFRDISLPWPESSDLDKIEHFVRIEETICLVDYGGEKLAEILIQRRTEANPQWALH